MLNIYWLRQVEGCGSLTGPYSDEMLACIVAAPNEKIARKIAAVNSLEEDKLGYEKDGNTEIIRDPSAWEDPKLTNCLKIGKADGGFISSKQMILANTVHPS